MQHLPVLILSLSSSEFSCSPGFFIASLIAKFGKESACNAGDPSSIPGSGRSAGERIGYPLQYSGAFLVAQLVKNSPPMRETWVQSLGWEDPLEKGKAAAAAKSLQSCPTLCDIMDYTQSMEFWSG